MKFFYFIEKLYFSGKVFISIICSLVFVVLYHFGFIEGLRVNISNIIAFLAALLVIVTLILTLLLYLMGNETYSRHIKNFKNSDKEIFQFMLCIINSNIICMIMLIIVSVLSSSIYFVYGLKIFILFIGVFLLSYTTLGTLYMLFLTVDIVTNVNCKKNKNIP